MGYKWYKLDGYKPFWNNTSTSVIEHHIEDIVNGSNSSRIKMSDAKWVEIKNAVQWSFPMDSATLIAKQENKPNYIKCTDGINNFYFYFVGIVTTKALSDGTFSYECSYELDRYMTIMYPKLQILKNKNPSVKFLRKFTDRFKYTLNPDGTIKTASLNLYDQKQFGMSLPCNPQMVREFLYATDELKLWNNNYETITRPAKVDFNNWNSSGTTFSVNWSEFITPNINGRFQYIVCKSSALQVSTVAEKTEIKTFAKDTKLIIPVFNDQKQAIFNALLNIDITTPQPSSVNALSSGNVIGVFECDVPFSLLYGLSETNSSVKRAHGRNIVNGTENYDIAYFEIPTNFAPKWTLINFDEYNKGFDGRLKTMLENIYQKWDITTEPTLLNSVNYQERCAVDNDKTISTDLSLLNYTIDMSKLTEIGLSLKAYFMFDNALHIAYDYENFNNQLNPLWNNKNSNLRSDISLQVGVFGSAQANYYESNANTSLTSVANRQSEQVQDWLDFGFNSANAVLDVATQPILGWLTGKNYVGAIKSGINIAKSATDTAMSNARANQSLSSSIRNIASSPATIMTNPYIDSGIPNKELDGGTLFQTFSNELHPWDKKVALSELMNNGYPYNFVDTFKSYDNRQYMNILHVDHSYNQDELVSLLIANDTSLFNGINYIYDFLTWIGTLHRLYKTDYLINVVDPDTETYIPNIETSLPPAPTQKININTIIKTTNLNTIFVPDAVIIKNYIKELNEIPTNLDEYLYVDTITNSSAVVQVKTNPFYYGYVIVTFDIRTSDAVRIKFKDNTVLESIDPLDLQKFYRFDPNKEIKLSIGDPFILNKNVDYLYYRTSVNMLDNSFDCINKFESINTLYISVGSTNVINKAVNNIQAINFVFSYFGFWVTIGSLCEFDNIYLKVYKSDVLGCRDGLFTSLLKTPKLLDCDYDVNKQSFPPAEKFLLSQENSGTTLCRGLYSIDIIKKYPNQYKPNAYRNLVLQENEN